jgi:RNase P protein component
MREAVRREYSALAENWAIVFNPRRSALGAPFPELCREVGRIFNQCGRC